MNGSETTMRFFFLFFVLTILVNCSTKYVPVEMTQAHHSEHNSSINDSIFVRDSIFIYINGDTVRETRYRNVFRDRILRDTVFKCDTIPKVVTVEVEKRLTNLQQLQLNIGAGVMWIVPVIVGLWVFFRKMRD